MDNDVHTFAPKMIQKKPMKTVILYEELDETFVFSNKQKAFEKAQKSGYFKSYNHFCTTLKAGQEIYISMIITIKQKQVL
jgi:hypothetical protein